MEFLSVWEMMKSNLFIGIFSVDAEYIKSNIVHVSNHADTISILVCFSIDFSNFIVLAKSNRSRLLLALIDMAKHKKEFNKS